MQKLKPQFLFMQDISIRTRVKWILVMVAIGFALQIFVSPIVGWFSVFAGAMMGATKGKSNKPSLQGRGDWQLVTMEELNNARRLLEKTSNVRSESLGASSVGCLGLLAILFVGFVLYAFADGARIASVTSVVNGGPMSTLFVADGVTFMLVFWLSGSVSAWEPPTLRTKFDQLSSIITTVGGNAHLELQPSMQLAKTSNGDVPIDIRLLVKIKDTDPNFIGIQVQVSFNKVQGSSLPYTYCVLLAKPEFNLTKRTKMIEMPPSGGFSVGFLGLFADENTKRESHYARFSGSLIELEKEGEVDIAVVRQDTSPAQGYTTDSGQALEVFSDAYLLTMKMLKEGGA